MSELRRLTPRDLEILLRRVKDSHNSASLRVAGTARMLGQLQVCGLEPGAAIHLAGAKQRDLLPPPGTQVTLSVILDEEVLSMGTVMLEPLEGNGLFGRQPGAEGAGRNGEPERAARTGGPSSYISAPRVLRAAWPSQPLEFHHRDDVRVAAPELPALDATLVFQGRRFPVQLLNLTETGMGLGMVEGADFPLHGEVVVETSLPGGFPLRLVGNVRHWGTQEDDPLPVRLGLVLQDLPAQDRESLRRMIQARRILRSESIRDE